MPSSEKEKLLDDLLRDANYEAFRRETEELSRAEFCAKHHRRSWWPYLALAASVVLIGTLVFISASSKKRSQDLAASRSNAAPTLAPNAFQRDQLPPISLITSVQLEPVEVVRSLADRSLFVSTPNHRDRALELVQSDPATIDSVNDAELIALFPNETVGFIASPSGRRFVLIAGPRLNLQMLFGRQASP